MVGGWATVVGGDVGGDVTGVVVVGAGFTVVVVVVDVGFVVVVVVTVPGLAVVVVVLTVVVVVHKLAPPPRLDAAARQDRLFFVHDLRYKSCSNDDDIASFL